MKIQKINWVVGCCVLCCAGLSADVSADVSVEPAGMKVVWKTLKKEFDGFQTFNSREGVYVSLALGAGGKGIIGFDEKKSKINLTAGGKDLDGGFGMWNKTSKDGKMMRVEVVSKKLPAVGVTDVKLSGEIALILSSKKETKATEVKAYKKGDKVDLVDGFSFEIKSLGKPKWGDDPLEISLEWSKKIPELAGVRFIDASGKEIKSSGAGSSSMGFMGKQTITKSYKLKKKVDRFKIEMDLWVGLEKVTVPVDMTLAVGGQKK